VSEVAVNSRLILERFYRVPPRKLRKTKLLQRLRMKLASFVDRYTVWLVLGTLFLGLWVFSHIYYYNILLGLRSNCDTAEAQIHAAEEKRDHIRRSLTMLLRFHANYERGVLEEVTTLRGPSLRPDATRSPATQTPPTPADLPHAGSQTPGTPAPAAPSPTALAQGPLGPGPLSRIDAVGEQYPNLAVNTTVNHASQALVEAEIDVHNRVIAYNTSVNMYTSYLKQFPGNMFGGLMGFHEREYYKPREQSGLEFEEISP
jgi:hypothetical protein